MLFIFYYKYNSIKVSSISLSKELHLPKSEENLTAHTNGRLEIRNNQIMLISSQSKLSQRNQILEKRDNNDLNKTNVNIRERNVSYYRPHRGDTMFQF